MNPVAVLERNRMRVLAHSTDRRMLGIYRFHVPVYITLDVESAALFLEDLDAALRVRLNSIQELVVLFVHASLGMPAGA